MQPVVWNMAYGNYQKKTDLLWEKAAPDMAVLLEINDRDWKAPECGVWKEHLNNHDHQYMAKSRSHQADQVSLKKILRQIQFCRSFLLYTFRSIKPPALPVST